MKVTALQGFEWHPNPDEEGKARRQKVAEGQTIDVTQEQAELLAAHGHIAPPDKGGVAPPSSVGDTDAADV